MKLRQEIEGEARVELQRARVELEAEGRSSASGKLCATPFGIDVVGISQVSIMMNQGSTRPNSTSDEHACKQSLQASSAVTEYGCQNHVSSKVLDAPSHSCEPCQQRVV